MRMVVPENATRPVQRRRKKTKPFFGFRTMDFYARGYTALAKCLGMTHRQLFDHCLRDWEEKAETILGFDVVRASHLSRAEIRAIAARVKLAGRATWNGGNQNRN